MSDQAWLAVLILGGISAWVLTMRALSRSRKQTRRERTDTEDIAPSGNDRVAENQPVDVAILAERATDLLLLHLSESGVAGAIAEAHEQARSSLPIPESPTPAHLKEQIDLEVLCFATVVIMTQEVPKVLGHRSDEVRDNTPDVEVIRNFNGELVKSLHARVDQQHWGLLTSRLSDYGKAGSTDGAADLFTQFVAASAGYSNYPTMKIVAARFWEPIITLSRWVVRRTFESPTEQ